MDEDLVITNGDVAGALLRRSLPGTEVLPWRDVLYDGPVPFTDSLSELSEIRADYLASCGWCTPAQLTRDFSARDRGLGASAMFDRVVLWFEHDLFDQLQLLQILDWFDAALPEPGKLLLVQSSSFLGTMTPDEISELRASEQPVREEQLALASRAWAAFRSDTPEDWAVLQPSADTSLPFLRPAMLRMLEELPGPNGLNRTERQMLEPLQFGTFNPPQLFGLSQRREEAMFMGDWSFWKLLDGLAQCETPLVEGLSGSFAGPDDAAAVQTYLKSTVRLTDFGRAVLAGEEDRFEENSIDRWWGGTHLTAEALWRWHPLQRALLAPGI